MPLSGFTAGLGKLNVSSGLGEPLKAEIELLSVSPEELSTLVVAIASAEAYAAQGITRLGIHNNIQVEVAKSSNGLPVLKLRSIQPVSDPYLDMLIQVDWASGRLQREYTVLLDPPGYKPPLDNVATLPIKSPSIKSDTPPTNLGNIATTSQKSAKFKKNIDASKISEAEQGNEGGETITTRRHDTLSTIANELQIEGVSLDQMLVGLYDANKKAFSNGNMNRLKVGQIIKVPTKESLTSITKAQATQFVKIHSNNWNGYRNTLASAVAGSAAMETAEQKQSASGKVGVAEVQPMPTTVPKDVIKLSAGNKAILNAVGNGDKLLQDKIVSMQEEAIAREKSLKETQDRTLLLEKQVQDMQKLLALKSQSMNDLQKNAELTATAENAKSNTSLPKTDELPLHNNSGDLNATGLQKNESALIANTPAKNIQKDKALTIQAQNKDASPVIAKVEASDIGFIQQVINSIDLKILGAIGAVAALAVGWLFLRNKRKKDLDSFEHGILTSGGLRANTVFGNTTGNASTSDTSFLTDFAQSADGSMIDTNDVDPIAEAEVYMAYGRDAQAEEILKDAILKEPKRYELHLKLLEMYAARKDISAFEAISGELYTTLGSDDPTWIKVAQIGLTMEPGNPLYAIGNNAMPMMPSANTDYLFEAPKTNNIEFSFDADPALDNNDILEQNNSNLEKSAEPLNFESEPAIDLRVHDLHADPENLPGINHLSGDEHLINVNSDIDNTIDFDLNSFNIEMTDEDIGPTNVLESNDTHLLFNDLTASAFELPKKAEINDSQVLDYDLDFAEPIKYSHKEVLNGDESPEILISDTHTISFEFEELSDTFNESDILSRETQPIIAFDPPSDAALSFEARSKINQDISTTDLNDIDSLDLDSHEDLSKSDDVSSSPDTLITFEAKPFDLSSINLELNDVVTEVEVPANKILLEEDTFDSMKLAHEIESPDIDIKLDLVSAYIDMEDKEGARELLEEIFKEGGVQQLIRAQHLLASLA